MPIAVACSHCESRFKVADKVAGKTVKCPKCGEAFKVVAAAAAVAVREAKNVPGPPPMSARRARDDDDEEPRRKRRRDDDDDDDDDRSRRPRRNVKKKDSKALVLGLCIGGGVLALLAIVITIVIVANSGSSGPPNPGVAQANPPGQGKNDAPNAGKVNPAPVNQQPKQPTNTKPAEKAPVVANTPAPKVLAPGAKITVRAEIQGSAPSFTGDYNKHVAQNLEIALRQRGYEPVAEGGLILQVRAQVGNSGKSIIVRSIGPGPRPPFGKGQPPPPKQNEQTYPIEQITATLLLTDAQGTALWKNENKFTPNITIFRTESPPREMQEQMWQSFDAWTRASGLATMR